jgi:hypothetical protein
MAISDVLFDAREEILGYLDTGHYGERKDWADIAVAVLAMDRLRLSPGFDVRPNDAPPKLPDDPMQYLDKIMAERAVEEE